MGLFNNDDANKNRGGGLRHVYDALKPSLNLSTDQETGIEQALEELKEERKNFMMQGDGNKEEMQAARRQIRQKIMEILNPAQKQLWHEKMQSLKERSE